MKKLLFILIVFLGFIACEKQNEVEPLPKSETVNIELYGSYWGTFTHIQDVDFEFSDTTTIDYTIFINDNPVEIKKYLLGAFWNRESFVGQIHLAKHELNIKDELSVCIKNNLVNNGAYIFANVFINDFKTKIDLEELTEFNIALDPGNITGLKIFYK